MGVDAKIKAGAHRLGVVGERLAWFRDHMALVLEPTESINPECVIELVEGYLSRFDEELEQIKLKNSIGGKSKRKQHASRQDTIKYTQNIKLKRFNRAQLEKLRDNSVMDTAVSTSNKADESPGTHPAADKSPTSQDPSNDVEMS